MRGGDFWQGAKQAAIISTLNHGLHVAADELKNLALIKKIRKEGWSPIELSENPHKATVEGYRVARLYSRGRLPELNEQFPNGFRIQDLFDMSSIPVGKNGWTDMSGEKIGSIYMYRHKDMTIRLDSKSFNIGDVSTMKNNEIRLFDDSDYWTEHSISWIKYSSNAHSRWLAAVSFINGKK